jgi:cation diffusion facilitator family transporter
MPDQTAPASPAHDHVFLGAGHEHAERRTWLVIWLCGAMMVLEIAGGALFGSIALVADGLHMSTHAGALLLAALAYSYARRHATDPRFSFGTGKLGDLAGFSSAIVLAMIAILIGYEAISRLFAPVPIHFAEAIPIAVLGLAVNAASAWLLSGGDHAHAHGHGHGHGDAHEHAHGESQTNGDDHATPGQRVEAHRVALAGATLVLSIFEDDHPAVFRLRAENGTVPGASTWTIETVRPGGARQVFALSNHGAYLQSDEVIAEPHTFTALLRTDDVEHAIVFEEHVHHTHDASDGAAHREPIHGAAHREPIHGAAHREPIHGAAHRDNNMRAAIVHVAADAAVSVLVIIGLLLARGFGWLWMDPLAGIIGAGVIASWSYGLVRDTGAILLDMVPDARVPDGVRRRVQAAGDDVTDLHVWRLGPGHLGAIVCIATRSERDAAFYREKLQGIPYLSHLTIEVARQA